MKCKDSECRKGRICMEKPVSIQTTCDSRSVVYPCDVCGRLHLKDGSLIFSRSGNKVFLKKGKIFHVDNEGHGYFL